MVFPCWAYSTNEVPGNKQPPAESGLLRKSNEKQTCHIKAQLKQNRLI